jgi:glycerol uptake facilitator-like aquaporin
LLELVIGSSYNDGMHTKYLVEGLGTFTLVLSVSLALSGGAGFPLAVPVLAALVVGVFVYTIGPISGCHLNPAVTLGVLSLKKLTYTEAAGYIASQVIGAGIAMVVGWEFFRVSFAAPTAPFGFAIAAAELVGTFFLTFGIASVVFGKVPVGASGVVIGGSLLLGVLVASLMGSSGILNPAVAFALHSLNTAYLLGPIAGSILGMRAYRALL